MIRFDSQNDVGQVQRGHWITSVKAVLGRAGQGLGTSQRHQVRGNHRLGYVVQLCGGTVMEPTGIGFPDRPHVPGGLPVTLADVEVVGKSDLAHLGMHVGTGIHAIDGSIMHPFGGVTHGGYLLGDAVGPHDGIEVASEEPLGAEGQHQVE